MKKVPHLLLALTTISLAQEIPPAGAKAAEAATSQENAIPQKEGGQFQSEEEKETASAPTNP